MSDETTDIIEDAPAEEAAPVTPEGIAEAAEADEPADAAPADEPEQQEPPTPSAGTPAPAFDPVILAKAQEGRAALDKEQDAIDAAFEDLAKKLEDPAADHFELAPKVQILEARQRKLDRQTQAIGKQLEQQAAAQKTAEEATWSEIGKLYKDVAETPEKAATLVRTIWDEEYAKVRKAYPSASEERIAGRAEAQWEQRISVLRANKGKAAPAKTTPTPTPQRLTPGPSGTTPTPAKRESAAEKVRRTLGPLKDWDV